MKRNTNKPLSFNNVKSEILFTFYNQMVAFKNIYRFGLEEYETELLNDIIHEDEHYKCICKQNGCNWCPWHNVERRYTDNPSYTCMNLRDARAPIKINDKLSLIAKISYIIKQAKKELESRGIEEC